MGKKLYDYTIYYADGHTKRLAPRPQIDCREIYGLIDCATFQLVPKVYWPDDIKRAEVYCDEEGLFKRPLIANPHFKEYYDPLFNDTRRIYGDVLVRQVHHDPADADAARNEAIDWESGLQDAPDMSYQEVADWQAYFERLVGLYPELADEFKENAII